MAQAADKQWLPDVLGGDFEMKYIDQGSDYGGAVRCTVVRLPLPGARRAVVYVHGFSDYFFQADMAETFRRHGYAFYAVDLRKYGRSLFAGQKPFVVRSMAEYFPDVQAAIDTAKADDMAEIVLMGHSTGGLTATLYMQATPDKAVRGLILNSPFLAWNLPAYMRRLGVPALTALSRLWPSMPVPSGGTIDYCRSLARHLGGEWEFDSRWKPDIMPDVDAGWIGAIERGHRALRRGKVQVPVLLLHSDRSAWPGDGEEAFAKSDGVLDVDRIAAAGRAIGDNVTEVTIAEGLHDLVLSRPDVRAAVYSAIFHWLKTQNI